MLSHTMKTTTAALAMIAAGTIAANAESHSDANSGEMEMGKMISISQIEDGAIYRMEVETDGWGDDDTYATVDPEWERVGDIEDVLINQEGQVVALLAEIGGFLDIGDRDVIVPLNNVKFVMGEGDSPTYNFVTNLTEEELEQLEETDEDMWD